MKIQLEFLRRKPRNVVEQIFDSRDYDQFDMVYNKEKDKVQIVLCEVDEDKRERVGVSKRDKVYICTEPGSNTWTREYGKDLRPATIFECK